ncbi:MAG: hypothetical protein DRO99_02520 [Candidatus Aenigmatarchaeota archaeon]|nr:MAG: hypothetical protein DRO99_02520 [Candidatus Aenigmarchaeota archaeon]
MFWGANSETAFQLINQYMVDLSFKLQVIYNRNCQKIEQNIICIHEDEGKSTKTLHLNVNIYKEV